MTLTLKKENEEVYFTDQSLILLSQEDLDSLIKLTYRLNIS